ncbi:glucose-6-phosphate isomerase [Priestia megaterium]|nr:glucose-6-phosphate isomerase [Priestia megaterium]
METGVLYNPQSGKVSGKNVSKSSRQLKHMEGYYEDTEAFRSMDPETPVYEVLMHAQEEGNEGGLLFGTSYLFPGKVGNEYFMTKGHFHEIKNRAEYYWGIQGEGALVLMDEKGEAKVEKVTQGSLHYIPGHIAHRLVNTSDSMLVVGACWPSDAGHDYGTIEENGFSVRVKEEDGKPVVK